MRSKLASVAIVFALGCSESERGASTGPPRNQPDACLPIGCESAGVRCGPTSDGCGALLDCGPCRAEFAAPLRVSSGAPGLEEREPSVAIESSGRVHVVWMEEGQNPDGSSLLRMMRSRSDDRGASFDPPLPTSSGPHRLCGDPDLLVDADDRVFLSGISIEPSAPALRRVFSTRLDERADRASAFTEVDDDVPADVDREWSALGSDGRQYIVWRRGFNQAVGELRLARSSDHGASFGPSTKVPSPAAPWGPLFATAAAGPRAELHLAVSVGERDAIAVRGIYHVLSTNGGDSFDEPVALPGVVLPRPTSVPQAVYFFAAASIDIAPDGTAFVAWGNQSASDADDIAVVVSRRPAQGGFLEPVRADGGAAALRYLSFMDVDERGIVHVAWIEGTASTGWSTMYGFSVDGGKSFSVPLRLTSEPFGGGLDQIGEFNDIAVRGGRIYVAWSAGQAGDEDVFVASGELVGD